MRRSVKPASITDDDVRRQVPKLHLVKGDSQPDDIFEQVGLSHPKEIKPSSSETNKAKKTPEHLQAIKDVELFRAVKMTATELRKKYASTYTNWSGMKTRCRADPQTGISPVALHPSFDIHSARACGDRSSTAGVRQPCASVASGCVSSSRMRAWNNITCGIASGAGRYVQSRSDLPRPGSMQSRKASQVCLKAHAQRDWNGRAPVVSYHRLPADVLKVHLHELENDLIGGYYEATRMAPELQFSGGY